MWHSCREISCQWSDIRVIGLIFDLRSCRTTADAPSRGTVVSVSGSNRKGPSSSSWRVDHFHENSYDTVDL